MSKPRLSCRFCWTRAISTFGLVAVFFATGALHLIDPSGIEHYGFPAWSSYPLATVEISAAIAFLLGFDVARFVFLVVAITGACLHVRSQEWSLLALPAIPLTLLATLWWANRPRAACSCGLRLHSNLNSEAAATESCNL